MGIYPHETIEGKCSDVLKLQYKEPGLETVYVYQLITVIVDCTECFCCTCPEGSESDVYCRNHGYYGTRPCEEHNMPGLENDEGHMPLSVQEMLAGQVKTDD